MLSGVLIRKREIIDHVKSFAHEIKISSHDDSSRVVRNLFQRIENIVFCMIRIDYG